MDRIDVRYVARLARLQLTDEEVALFEGQLAHIVGHIRTISRLDLGATEPTSHTHPLQNVFRPDEPRPSLDRTAVLRNAPASRDGQFAVPKIVE